MSGLSRSEQRQLEAVMKASKAEAGIKDSSSDEDTPMSKKVNTGDSARKKVLRTPTARNPPGSPGCRAPAPGLLRIGGLER
jgi:hypothetical protein